LREIGNDAHRETGRWLDNRAENSHQPFRRREGAMTEFRSPAALQKFASIHASIHDHFNRERHLRRRDIFKQNRSTALSEWQRLCAA
jgi:putative transposase